MTVMIDAAAALRILMSPDDKVADPHKQADFTEQRARPGRLRLLGFRGHAPVSEPIPIQDVCNLHFDWLADASKGDDQLGQLDLMREWAASL